GAACGLGKFVRRHKGPVLAASVIVFLLAAGIVGTTTGLVRAVTERDQKDKALQQVVKESDQKDEALRQKDENWRKARRALKTAPDGGGEERVGGAGGCTPTAPRVLPE